MSDDEQGLRDPAAASDDTRHDASGSSRGDVTGGDRGDDGAREDEPDSVGSADDEDSDKKHGGSFWKELPILVGVALALALVIKAFAVQAFYIPSQSMENTLKVGDRVLVNKIVYHTRPIKRGDVVVFNGLDSWDPEVQYSEPTNPFSKALRAIGSAFGVVPGEKDYIKRVIGIPGDHVACCDDQGRVTVNGHPLTEGAYIYRDPRNGQPNKPSDATFTATVPPGHLWVMGDHREVSYDSRGHLGDPGGGTIPEDRVIGRAFAVVWPLPRINTMPIPATFDTPGLALAGAAMPVPLALGFACAVPMTLANRRRRRQR